MLLMIFCPKFIHCMYFMSFELYLFRVFRSLITGPRGDCYLATTNHTVYIGESGDYYSIILFVFLFGDLEPEYRPPIGDRRSRRTRWRVSQAKCVESVRESAFYFLCWFWTPLLLPLQCGRKSVSTTTNGLLQISVQDEIILS